MTHFLDFVASFTGEERGEGSCSDARRVCFHNSDGRLHRLGRDSQAGADTTHSCRRGGHVRVRPKIHVQHCGVSPLSNDSLAWIFEGLVHVVDPVYDHLVFFAVEALVKLSQLV